MSLNKTFDLNQSEIMDNGRNNITQDQVKITGDPNETNKDGNVVPECELKFFLHQFDKQQFYTGTKDEWKHMMSNADLKEDGQKISLTTSIGRDSIDTMTKILNKKQAEIIQKQKDDDNKQVVVSDKDKLQKLDEIKILPEVAVELKSREQLSKIQDQQSKTAGEIIQEFRMNQYITRFNKGGKEIVADGFLPSDFSSLDQIKGQYNQPRTPYVEEDEKVEEKTNKKVEEKTDEKGDEENTTTQANPLKKLPTFKDMSQFTKHHDSINKDLKFGKTMRQGQISDLVRWGQQTFVIQKVFDDTGDLHLQIIPYGTLNFTPLLNKKKSFQLTTNEGTPDFKKLGANPEGKIWIQYNQYIYFFTIKNCWVDGENKNSFVLTRKCFDLLKYELCEEDEKVMQPVQQHDVTLNERDSTNMTGGTQSQGARCVVFSTPMAGPPVLDEKGQRVKVKKDLIQKHNVDKDEKKNKKKRIEWLESHYILVQSACEIEQSHETFHTGEIFQCFDDFLLAQGYHVAIQKPRQSLAFNLCHWTKDALKQGKDKVVIKGNTKGILQVLYHDSGQAIELEQFAINPQQGAKKESKHTSINYSKLHPDTQELLGKQAVEVFDGQYQKVYTTSQRKVGDEQLNELYVEMMSTRTDQFKYKMAARIGVISQHGCMNYRNNIIMIYHQDYNKYQVIANEDGKINFSSIISNNTESNLILHNPFYKGNATFMQKLHMLYGEGFKQFHPFFINILVTHEGKLVYIDHKTGDPIHDSIRLNADQNKDLHKFQIKHHHDHDTKNKRELREAQFHLEQGEQRRFQAHDDDRTVWVGLKYVGLNNQYIYLQVIQGNKVILNRIGGFDFAGEAQQKKLTSLCASSPVARVKKEKHENTFTQTYSLAIMSKSKLFVKIMEYQLQWEENASATQENTKFTQIGRKLLILNKPYEQQTGLSKTMKKPMNFFPHFNQNENTMDKDKDDSPDYLINGTNLFANNDKSDWNIFIPNFEKDDYQFDGELCSSGFKKYHDYTGPQGTKRSQQRAILIDTRLSSALINATEEVLTPSQRNLIFEQQMRTMLNMWPKKDMIESIQKYYSENDIDPLAGLEVTNCNCLADYLISQPNLLDKALNISDAKKEAITSMSFIEQFGKEEMFEEVEEGTGKDAKTVIKNYYEDLCKAFPQELEWVRKPFCLTDDLLMSNPLVKCFEGEMDQTIASVRILINNVFDSGRSSVSYNRLIQILPDILDPDNMQYGFSEYGQFFSDYGEDGSMDNLTFAIKLIHEDLPKFSDEEAFMKQFELKRRLENAGESNQYYPNTDIREKAMDMVKELDKKGAEPKVRFKHLRKLFPESWQKAASDFETKTLGDDEEQGVVKNIPVDHFLVNLNFLAASKLINQFFKDEIYIDDQGEKKEKKPKTEEEKEARKDRGVHILLKEGSGVSELQFVKMIKDINTKYSNGINEQQALQDIIDYIFIEKTQQFVQYKFFAYIMLFIIPYMVQLLANMPTYSTLFLCLICELWKVFEFYYEYIQFKTEGFSTYIKDYNNIFDFTSLISYQIYFVIRFFLPGHQFVGMQSQLDVNFFTVLNIFLNMIIVINICIQMLSYLQVEEKMGLLVQLVNQCLWDIKEFLCFFLIFILFFGLTSKALGSDNSLGAYPNIDIYTQIMIQTWQNSIGNINPPSTTYWNTHQKSHDPSVALAANVAIYVIYFVWFVNQALILIVLMNFLIAVISQSYENVMDTAVMIKYSQRCDLNHQVALVYEHSHVLKKDYDCVILSSNTQHGGDNQWSGFCQSVKGFVKESNAKIFTNIQKANDQLDKTKGSILNDVDGARLIIKRNVDEVEKLLDDLKEKINVDERFHNMDDHDIQQSAVMQSMVE